MCKSPGFPFEQPYSVQLELMGSLSSFLKGDEKLGLFESPTGTGKSLSLLCAVLAHHFKIESAAESSSFGDDWLSSFGQVQP